MTALPHRLTRLVGLLALWQALTLLERVAYAAGVAAAAAPELDDAPAPDLEPADVTDVVLLHIRTYHGPDAPRVGECAC